MTQLLFKGKVKDICRYLDYWNEFYKGCDVSMNDFIRSQMRHAEFDRKFPTRKEQRYDV